MSPSSLYAAPIQSAVNVKSSLIFDGTSNTRFVPEPSATVSMPGPALVASSPPSEMSLLARSVVCRHILQVNVPEDRRSEPGHPNRIYRSPAPEAEGDAWAVREQSHGDRPA